MGALGPSTPEPPCGVRTKPLRAAPTAGEQHLHKASVPPSIAPPLRGRLRDRLRDRRALGRSLADTRVLCPSHSSYLRRGVSASQGGRPPGHPVPKHSIHAGPRLANAVPLLPSKLPSSCSLTAEKRPLLTWRRCLPSPPLLPPSILLSPSRLRRLCISDHALPYTFPKGLFRAPCEPPNLLFGLLAQFRVGWGGFVFVREGVGGPRQAPRHPPRAPLGSGWGSRAGLPVGRRVRAGPSPWPEPHGAATREPLNRSVPRRPHLQDGADPTYLTRCCEDSEGLPRL